MWNPCKACIVRANCSQVCDKLIKFIDDFSVVAAILSIVFASIFTLLFLFLCYLLIENYEQKLLYIIWFICVILAIYLNLTRMENLFNNIFIIVATPFSLFCILSILILVNVQKKYVRKKKNNNL